MTSKDFWLTVGKFIAPQGLKGEIRVKSNSEFPERFTKPGKRWIQEKQKEPKQVQLLSGRVVPGKSIYIVRFQEINNRNLAEEIIGQNLLVKSSDRPKLKENEFHFLDLVGLEAKVDSQKKSIGKIINLVDGGNDLLEIELEGGRRVLIPFVKEIVPEVKIDEGWIRITPPNGLLDL